MDFTQELIIEKFIHDNTTGKIFSRKTGREITSTDDDGYIVVSATVAPRKYGKMRGARLVWVMYNGEIPEGYVVDHINRERQDNRIENLRLATHRQNAVNSKRSEEEVYTSRYKGVQLDKQGRWVASIQTDSVTTLLGRFTTEESAAYAYNLAASERYGEFAALNNVPEVDLQEFISNKTLKDFSEERRGLPAGLIFAQNLYCLRDNNKTLGSFLEEHFDDAVLFSNHYNKTGDLLDLKTNKRVYNKFGLPLNVFPCSTGFRASFVHNYKRTHVGTFKTVEEAYEVLREKQKEVKGFID